MPDLTPAQARASRLASLLLASSAGPPRSAAEVVEWFGALQSQDVASGLWSLGVRVPAATESQMLAALEDRQILRTWPMRGTIHLVPSVDAAWMLELMSRGPLATGPRRREQLGLSLADVERARDALAVALTGGRSLTRAQALAVVNDAGVTTEGQRGYHVLWYAAQTGVTGIGPQVEGEQTFVLLADWCPAPRRLDAREAAAELAFRYFRSHGPATVQDFAGWTGLPLGVSRTAVADNDGRLVPATVSGATVWLTPEARDAARTSRTIVLPGFDEFVLGYKDRSLQVPEGRMDAIVPGGNGIFRATIVRDGVVRGTWKRTLTPTTVKVAAELFQTPARTQRSSIEQAFAQYATYLGRSLQVTVDVA